MPLLHRYRDLTRRPPRQGFTLLQLLAVIAIIGVLTVILIPVLGLVRKSARTTQDLGAMRILGQSMLDYAADNRGTINQWGFEQNKGIGSDNSFWGRAWPYLKNTQLKQLTTENMKKVADDFLSAVITSGRPDLVANAEGINYTIAFNKNLFTMGDTIPGYPSLNYSHFLRIQNVARPSAAPWITTGIYGFWYLTPEPLPVTRPSERAYWPYDGNRTIAVLLDGSTRLWSEALTKNELKARSIQ